MRYITLSMLVLILLGSSLFGPLPALLISNSQQSNQVVVQYGYFEYIPIVAISNETSISYSTSSNASISTAFMTSTQFSSFNSTGSDISNSLYDQNGTSNIHSLVVGQGTYYFVFYSYSSTANVTYTYTISPINPYENGPIVSPQPTGIASFGLYNYSGNVLPYTIKTNQVVGTANISSILSYNATAASVNDTLSGATLQLNSMLVVNDASGTQKVYWAQNTPDFVTNSSVISYGDNVWNNTDYTNSLSNSSIVSQNGGYVLPSNSSGQIGYYYALATPNSSYAFPFDISLIMNESVLADRGVMLQMGVSVLRNGSFGASPIDWFDSIMIKDPSATSAYFYTSGNISTPVGTFYDTELVFGGEGNGESTHFNEMNSSLGLYYYNGTSGALVTFPTYYSFGGDTAEAADNLHVAYLGHGVVHVTVGTPNYVYLNETTSKISSSSSIESASSTISSSRTLTSTTTLSSSLTTGGESTSPNFVVFAGIAVIVVIIAAAGIYLSVRRKPAQF